ncbi:hypothetical protein BDR03DRAFT_954129, partial [Suillus americanus]
MCIGIFNALSGLGASGQVDATTSADTFATHCATPPFLQGQPYANSVSRPFNIPLVLNSVHNMLGSRVCLLSEHVDSLCALHPTCSTVGFVFYLSIFTHPV